GPPAAIVAGGGRSEGACPGGGGIGRGEPGNAVGPPTAIVAGGGGGKAAGPGGGGVMGSGAPGNAVGPTGAGWTVGAAGVGAPRPAGPEGGSPGIGRAGPIRVAGMAPSPGFIDTGRLNFRVAGIVRPSDDIGTDMSTRVAGIGLASASGMSARRGDKSNVGVDSPEGYMGWLGAAPDAAGRASSVLASRRRSPSSSGCQPQLRHDLLLAWEGSSTKACLPHAGHAPTFTPFTAQPSAPQLPPSRSSERFPQTAQAPSERMKAEHVLLVQKRCSPAATAELLPHAPHRVTAALFVEQLRLKQTLAPRNVITEIMVHGSHFDLLTRCIRHWELTHLRVCGSDGWLPKLNLPQNTHRQNVRPAGHSAFVQTTLWSSAGLTVAPQATQ
ncbi:hypothetical protein ACFL59_15540, partial [Planctomycetota bacterium]